jgi:GNAT superfamily N-acetyltransferase
LSGNRSVSATLTQGWSELRRLGHRPSAGEKRRQSHGRVPVHHGGQLAAGEVSLAVSDRSHGLSERIDAELGAFNAEMTRHRDLRPLHVAAWDHDDLLAGLCGSTWGGCGFIELLWVRADYRRRGLGARLLEAGESEIRRRGCDQVALSTYSFQAPGFYIRAGYIECGRRSGFPHSHDQILFTKRLS